MSDAVEVHVAPPGEAPNGLLDAFWDYEGALMANDLAALDRLFAPGPDTLRGDAGGLLVGHDAISAFRRGRGGAPQRRILSVHVRAVTANVAVVVAVYAPVSGGRGQQTQLWSRVPGDPWTVSVAHVSTAAPAVNSTVWRVVGTPLVEGAGTVSGSGSGDGSLAGHTVAVKDLFSIEGHAIGGGVPEYLASASPATSTSSAVVALLDAGASVTGIARTDEFAYSIAGRNPHYGTPPNPAVVGGIPGGSSSGPASAVALGQASIGLGTDTGGSIRVPASYQGLWGLRTTQGAVGVDGLLPLAPSFDTVGWLTRDAGTLRAAAATSLDASRQVTVAPRYLVSEALAAELAPDVRDVFEAAVAGLDAEVVDLGDPAELFEIYRFVQGAEAWRTHGEWITAHPGALGDEIGARFAWASTITPDQEADARARLAQARSSLDAVLGDGILLLPSAASPAPSATAPAADIESARAATMRLTCVAGLSGRPGLSVPVMSVSVLSAPGPSTLDGQAGGAPVGLCLVGPRFSDLALIDRALTDLAITDRATSPGG